MKRVIAVFLCVLLLCGHALAASDAAEEPAETPEPEEERVECVVVGADLTDAQVESVYVVFGLERGSVPEILLTNAEERALLEGKVEDSLLGEYSVSCVYIRQMEEGSGTQVYMDNVTWCTAEMYRAALETAGITDVQAIIASPFQVSGTAALAGIYKAYETMTGSVLDPEAKELGTLELITSAGLADELGAEDAGEIVEEMKTILDETREMTDEELREKIRSVARGYGFTLNDAQVEQIFDLCRGLEALNIRGLIRQAEEAVEKIGEMGEKAREMGERAETLAERLRDFFSRAADFLSGLLGN